MLEAYCRSEHADAAYEIFKVIHFFLRFSSDCLQHMTENYSGHRLRRAVVRSLLEVVAKKGDIDRVEEVGEITW